jgi:hypothetical protein
MSIVEPSRAIEVAPIGDTSVLAFFCDMNVPERGTFWACASGRALDGMDFMIYPLVGTIIFSDVGAFLTNLDPTRLRGSGQVFCYNFGRGIGDAVPVPGRRALDLDFARQRHRDLRRTRLRRVLYRRFRAAGKTRPNSACGCLKRSLPFPPHCGEGN